MEKESQSGYTPSRLERPIRAIVTQVPMPVRRSAMAALFRTFGAPKLHQRMYLPRKPMLIDIGDDAVLVGTPNPSRVHQLRDYVGESGQVLILEPVPESYQQLVEAAEQYSNVIIDSRAAGSEAKTEIMPVDINNQIVPYTHPSDIQKEFEVEFHQLDHIVADYEINPDYLEVMVNGQEADVIEGATEILRGGRPRVLIKSFGYNTSEWVDDEQIQRMLRQATYRVIRAPARNNPPGLGAPDGDLLALPK